MHHLKYRCETAGATLSSGIYMDDTTLTKVWHSPLDIPFCPSCGGRHRLRVMEAYVNGVTEVSSPGRWRAVLAARVS